MNRKTFLRHLVAASAVPFVFTACARATSSVPEVAVPETPVPQQRFTRLVKPRSEWRRILDEDQYHVMFEQGTERPGSSPLNREKRAGTYVCAACALPLFDASTKFESGTGWPSFFRPLRGRIGTHVDRALGMERTEYHCARCDAHQGHIFEDGPAPTRLRHCNNGVALAFVPRGQRLPALRT